MIHHPLLKKTFLLFLFLFSPAAVFALYPMVHYHDLVAGKGDHGFVDGNFTEACFDDPAGLAVNADGTKLFVSDQNNNRIRLVNLERQNQVSTVAGSGLTGKSDGSLLDATFNHPTAIVYIPGDKLIVYDSGNFLFREVDLKRNRVSTLAGNGSPQGGPRDGPVSQVGLLGVRHLAYIPSENTLYYTLADTGRLEKIILGTNTVQTVVLNSPDSPHPNALCVSNNKLYFSDFNTSQVFRVDFSSNTLPASSINAAITQIGQGKNIYDLAVSGDIFYALQFGDTPCARVNPYSPVSLISVTGDFLDDGKPGEPPFFNFQNSVPVLISDPTQERRFFFTNSNLNAVYSFKDYDFDRWKAGRSVNPSNLSDYDYPALKPPHTYRILIVGNSMTFINTQAEEAKWGKAWGLDLAENRVLDISKRLEFYLNLLSSLKNNPEHYEVLNMGRLEGEHPLISWPYFSVPEAVKKFDIDLVLMVESYQATPYYEIFYQRPLDADGIPKPDLDGEYFLKPANERIPPGLPGKFYKRCLSKGWVDPQLKFMPLNCMLSDGELKKDLEGMTANVISKLNKKMNAENGKTISFWLCFIPEGERGLGVGPSVSTGDFESFWSDISRQSGVPWMNLTDPFLALEPTSWPIRQEGWGNHLNENGHWLWSFILGQELIDRHLIP